MYHESSTAVNNHVFESRPHIPTIRRPTFLDNIHVTLVAGYLAIAGIYWLPGISHTLLSQSKLVLYGLLVVTGLLRLKLYSIKQKKIYLWLLVCGTCAFIANSITTDLAIAVSQARNYMEPLLWLVALSGIQPCAFPLFISRLKTTLSIFFLISLYPVGAYIGLFPNFYAPEVLADPTGLHLHKDWVLQSASIVGGGFSGSRTGWGVTVSTTALLFAALFMRRRNNNKLNLVFVSIIVAGSMASIIVTGARGGTIALFAVAIYSVFVARGYKASKLLLLSSFLLFVFFFDFVALLPENFFRNFDASGDLFARLNAITTGRLGTYVGAINHFMESPFFGKGLIEARVGNSLGQEASVHNLWLRQLAESGIVLFIPLLLLTLHVVSLIRVNPVKNDSKKYRLEWPISRYVILCGLIMAIIEPSAVIGSFNANAVFWTAVWMELARRRARPMRQMRSV